MLQTHGEASATHAEGSSFLAQAVAVPWIVTGKMVPGEDGQKDTGETTFQVSPVPNDEDSTV